MICRILIRQNRPLKNGRRSMFAIPARLAPLSSVTSSARNPLFPIPQRKNMVAATSSWRSEQILLPFTLLLRHVSAQNPGTCAFAWVLPARPVACFAPRRFGDTWSALIPRVLPCSPSRSRTGTAWMAWKNTAYRVTDLGEWLRLKSIATIRHLPPLQKTAPVTACRAGSYLQILR